MESNEMLDLQPVSTFNDGISEIIPCREYLLQGSIMDSHVTTLLHRLQGLCDDPDIDNPVERFHDLEMCYSLSVHKELPLSLVPQVQVLYLRVRRALDHDSPEYPWLLRYTGEPELGTGDEARPTIIRTSLDILVTPSIVDYLELLGAKLEFEYTAQGYLFKKGCMKITVSKIKNQEPAGSLNLNKEFITQSYLVELSAVVPSGLQNVGKEVRAFAEKLEPLVYLEKIDYMCLSPL